MVRKEELMDFFKVHLKQYRRYLVPGVAVLLIINANINNNSNKTIVTQFRTLREAEKACEKWDKKISKQLDSKNKIGKYYAYAFCKTDKASRQVVGTKRVSNYTDFGMKFDSYNKCIDKRDKTRKKMEKEDDTYVYQKEAVCSLWKGKTIKLRITKGTKATLYRF
ncbi:hypothetical protein [Prochlorococcus sp. MIT 1300]|uniref:hypothetical protein n=1 Tax=Prochlorococcus sp. MIT 1300 TaxID=3096218 RepID=UPI002A752B29|nr:hypothetical protein [Prochlorococcus sp. MIT 1300]